MSFDPITMIVQLLALGAAWGHLVSKVNSHMKRGDERHQENIARLEDIKEQVDKINGTVREHDRAIERLRVKNGE